MNTQAVRTAPRSPWQNAYVERVIGSIRRECLDHLIVVNAVGAATRTPCAEFDFETSVVALRRSLGAYQWNGRTW
jgi:hypothetical protein